MDAERIAEARRRSEEVIARADAVLAAPRPVYDEHEIWRAPEPTVMRRPAPAQPAPKPRQSAPQWAPRAWVRSLLDTRQDALERAVGRIFGAERYRLNLRCAETERRLAAIEARIAQLERRP